MSHLHGPMVQGVIESLAARHEGQVAQVILTHNVPEPSLVAPPSGWPFRVTELFNESPMGFGTNHNQAFRRCETPLFCVLNPDVGLPDSPLWTPLAEAASRPGVGLAYPRLVNTDGTPQENEREAVTPLALLRRHFLRRRQTRTDWVSGAFWLVSSKAFRQIRGFDERYFMYCEDTDFCLRLQLAGFAMARVQAQVMHAAGHASRRLGPHLAWHLRSLLRLWFSPALREYLKTR